MLWSFLPCSRAGCLQSLEMFVENASLKGQMAHHLTWLHRRCNNRNEPMPGLFCSHPELTRVCCWMQHFGLGKTVSLFRLLSCPEGLGKLRTGIGEAGETSPEKGLSIQRIKWKLAFLQKSKSGNVYADGIANSCFAITSRKRNVFHLLPLLPLAQCWIRLLLSSAWEMESWGITGVSWTKRKRQEYEEKGGKRGRRS